jgi:ArsR family transcriptional regulator
MKPISSLFGAFADPTRLRILNLLVEQKELCVCDLCAVLGEIQPKVSRHLAVLRRAGLVEVRREGKWKFYAAATPPSPLHRTLLRCIRGCLGPVDELVADRERLRGLATQLRCS